MGMQEDLKALYEKDPERYAWANPNANTQQQINSTISAEVPAASQVKSDEYERQVALEKSRLGTTTGFAGAKVGLPIEQNRDLELQARMNIAGSMQNQEAQQANQAQSDYQKQQLTVDKVQAINQYNQAHGLPLIKAEDYVDQKALNVGIPGTSTADASMISNMQPQKQMSEFGNMNTSSNDIKQQGVQQKLDALNQIAVQHTPVKQAIANQQYQQDNMHDYDKMVFEQYR